ncbi:lysophospholipid acyltransferase family protein [Diaphorobacter aerolatus]|uniref:Lysophospholipid acyltransferase family protein n=1 Tax=Diaphorobacter aerolatus TaxID=1288495 RepID=A0A7H0GNJ2_9BURK|nr:lysophospholipid acyltransferase family protein [Diaphorobacter aerolatus]QNP49858.1 lysophospholipid acyltransferase family protein [Diaphorobacter aerolatus]
MLSFFRLLSVLPIGLLHFVGAGMGWVTFGLSPTYRRRFVDNAKQAGFSFAQVRKAVGHAGRMVFEMPRIWLGRSLPRCTIEGVDCIESAFAQKKGILFLTPHIGCFELSVQVAAQRWSAQYGAITVLYRPARQAWLAQILETARNRGGVQAVPTTLAGVRQMIKALRKGSAVGLLPDQVPPQGLGIWSPFFGRDAYTMTLAARLALQTGAAIIVARCERMSWGRGYRLYVEELATPLSPTLEAAVQEINAAMERTIRQCPEQYLWGYGRYKQPRVDPQMSPSVEDVQK